MIEFGQWQGRLDMGLAPRELQCIMGLASGFTQKELARDMKISVDGVRKRQTSAMYKLGVNRATQLVAEAMKRQIISPLCMMLAALVVAHAAFDEDPMRRDRRAPERRTAQVRMMRRAEAPEIYA